MNMNTQFENTALFGEASHRLMNNSYDYQHPLSRNASFYIPSSYHLCLSSDDEEENNRLGFSGGLLYDGTSCNSTTDLGDQQKHVILHNRSESYDTSLSLSPLSPLSPPAPWYNAMNQQISVSPRQDDPIIQNTGYSMIPNRTGFDGGHCATSNHLLVHPFLPHSIDSLDFQHHAPSSSIGYDPVMSPIESSDTTPMWISTTKTILDQWGEQVLSEIDKHTFQLAGKHDVNADASLPNLLLDNVSPKEASLHLKKFTHNAIERRYRNNINHRIIELKNVVPALCDVTDDAVGNEDVVVDGVQVADKVNKATILRKATEYIGVLKRSNSATSKENDILQEIIGQMPGGALVLSEFKQKQRTLQLAEEKRQDAIRQITKENDRIDHQRLLRERAAQRAELAKLVPKSSNGRRPYQKRSPRRVRQSTKLQS